MDEVLALRPFVPARDFALSKAFYVALGFTATHQDETVIGMKLGSFGFILQSYYVKEFAENCMLQLMVRNVESWWQQAAPEKVAEQFGLKAPSAPKLQPWGMKVGFIFDPSGVLWHVAEAVF